MNKQVFGQIKSFEKGDYVKVSWYDASDARGPLSDHKKSECLVDEWGVFLGVEGLLRVDRKFRTYGFDEQKMEYHKRPLIEVLNSFLKTQFSMANIKVRGLKQVAFYALCSLLCLVLNREAAQNIGKHEKAVSPTYFNT